jgi:hypothetical protein
MASKLYLKGRAALHGANVDLDGATIVAILCSSSYTPNQDTHEFITDLTNELSGGGYARVTITGKVITTDAGTNTTKWTSDPIVFPALTGTFRYMVLAVNSGSDATSRLIKYSDYTTDQTAAGVDVTLTPHANGLATDVAA